MVVTLPLAAVRTRRWRLLLWLLGLVGAGFALKFLTGFPWRVTFTALLEANPWLLAIALVAHLSSLVAKGWGWHLILRPVAAHRWRVAQEANLVGAAVNTLSVAVAGEAARVHVMAPSVLQLEPWLRAVQVGVGLTVVVVLLLAWARGWAWLWAQLPASLQARFAVLRTMVTGWRLSRLEAELA